MRHLRALVVLGLIAGHLGCAGGADVDLKILSSTSATAIWEAGQEALQGRHYSAARRYFRRIVDGFPQHETAPEARLALADSYFLSGHDADYILAVAAYREFLTFYPSHPKGAYAQFQVGESYFQQRNPPDRDQTATDQALAEFQRLLEQYPDSAEVEATRDRIIACRQILAEYHFRIGYFYQKTGRSCRAAVGRFETILDEYPDYQELDQVLFRMAQCLAPTIRWPEAPPYLEQLLDEHPESEFAQEAEQLLATLRERPPLPPPAPPVEAPPPAGGDEAQVSL